MKNLKKQVLARLEPDASGDAASKKFRGFEVFLVVLICLNIAAVILSTVESVERRFAALFRDFEVFSVIVFSLEYILRLWTCTEYPKFRSPFWGRLRYAVSPLAVVDLLAVLPFYLPMFLPVDLRFLRALRLFRLFRLFKLGRYANSLRLVGNVLSSRRGELFVTVFLIVVLLIVSSGLLYYAEREAQPEKFSSIPASMWWGVVTLTTVGYGDVFPVTPLGKVFSSIISFLGIGLFALPAGILGAGFLEEVKRKKPGNGRVCPHCGNKLDEGPLNRP